MITYTDLAIYRLRRSVYVRCGAYKQLPIDFKLQSFLPGFSGLAKLRRDPRRTR